MVHVSNAIFRKKFFIFFFLFVPSCSSHELDVSKQVLIQRIGDIEKEYEEKYADAKEQLKCDTRLTIDEIVRFGDSNE